MPKRLIKRKFLEEAATVYEVVQDVVFAVEESISTGINFGEATDGGYFFEQAPVGTEAIDEFHTGTSRNIIAGKCYNFDGADDRLDFGSVVNCNDFTFCVWINPDSLTNGMLISGGAASPYIRVQTTNVTLRVNGINYALITDPDFTTGEWQHFILVRSGANAAVYRNNVEVAPATSTDSLLIDFIKIGAFGTSGLPYDGKMFDARLYTRVLTAAEMEYVYTFGKTGTNPTTTNLGVHYKCDDNDPAIAYDSSGNGNNAVKSAVTASTFNAEDGTTPYSWLNSVGYTDRYNADNYGRVLQNPVEDDTTIEFDLVTTKDKFILFSNGLTEYFWCSVENNVGGTAVDSLGSSTEIKYYVDGVELVGVDRDALFQSTADGVKHSCKITGLNLAAETTFTTGLHFANYNGNTSAWQIGDAIVSNIKVNGVPVPNFIPRDESDTANDIDGNALLYKGFAPRDAKLVESACATFDGTDDRVDLTTLISLPVDITAQTPWEINIRYYKTTNLQRMLFGKYNTSNSRIYFFGTGPVVRVHLENGQYIDFNYRWQDARNLNTWKHLKFEFTGLKFLLTVDGVVYEAASGGTWIGTTTTFELDNVGLPYPTTTYIWDGRVCDFSCTLDGVLQVHLPMAEGYGDVHYDVSGNNNHGNIQNHTLANYWGNTQEAYHYNIINGFEEYDDDSTGLIFLRVPYRLDETKITPTISGYTKNGDNDAVVGHNDAETAIDFTGGIDAPWWNKLETDLSVTIPTSYNFGDTLPANMTKVAEAKKESKFIIKDSV